VHTNVAYSVAFSYGGQQIVSGMTAVPMGNISFREVMTNWLRCGLCLRGRLRRWLDTSCTEYAYSVAFSPDGEHIVSVSFDNLVKVTVVCVFVEGGCVTGLTRQWVMLCRSPSDSCVTGLTRQWVMLCRSPSDSPDRQHIVSGGGSEDNLVKVWSWMELCCL
jgi:WD40 repeat protein